ncbi:MAG: iron-sulfur cluster insertion protein ErpA [Acetobacter sp.]|jgi:iron-sulfur cluster assembly accessory protein|nr:iron-sulfur cluster insertion protein ErpA [Acetobacter sp.]MCH4059965.1 iron-sulfur cluster insertion protein ErpA [Acetobacter sp.]MCH4086906.1 iron-sulfur cluster insertion protein ErpA [Acetobacter sp.]MCI1294952.1 iron-sulfur cluster insertion protein ErpA [Acetobacter sp.]MCI1320924.1 iron-sulfur cluster insertion protein ErpA [Acetobacter sp.]
MSDTSGFRVSDRAASRIGEIIAARGEPDLALRVVVSAGGCNGFQYEFKLDAERASDDHVIKAGQVAVVVDPASLDLLAGGELDYTDKLMGAHFAITNPNAASSCGCGNSFSLSD